MPNCVVKGCKNETSKNKKQDGITYHTFPADPILKACWTQKLRLNRNQSSWMPSRSSIICSIHFKDEEKYTTKTGLYRLRRGAVPTRNVPVFSCENTNEQHTSVVRGVSVKKERKIDDTDQNKTQYVREETNDIVKVEPSSELDTDSEVEDLYISEKSSMPEELSVEFEENRVFLEESNKLTTNSSLPPTVEETQRLGLQLLQKQCTVDVAVNEDPLAYQAPPVEIPAYSTCPLSRLHSSVVGGNSMKLEQKIGNTYQHTPQYVKEDTNYIVKVKPSSGFTDSDVKNPYVPEGSSLPEQLPVKLEEENIIYVEETNELIINSSLPPRVEETQLVKEKKIEKQCIDLNEIHKSNSVVELRQAYLVQYLSNEKLREKLARLQAHSNKQKRKIRTLNDKVRLNKKRITALKNTVKNLKKKDLFHPILSDEEDECSLIDSLVKTYRRHNRVKRLQYSRSLIQFCLNLNQRSPEAYNYVRQMFEMCLPDPKTLLQLSNCKLFKEDGKDDVNKPEEKC